MLFTYQNTITQRKVQYSYLQKKYYVNFSKIFIVVLLFLTVVALMTGCAMFLSAEKRTKIIAVPFGLTTHVTEFKVGSPKPRGHIIWGNDVRDGASCKIVITNVSKATMVYRYDFIYKKASIGVGYNYFMGKNIEPDPLWNFQIGKYLLELTVDNKRISIDTFSILP